MKFGLSRFSQTKSEEMDYGYLKGCQDTYRSILVKQSENKLRAILSNREADREWTASRCQRLLRALTSRVTILRKEDKKYSNKQRLESGLTNLKSGSGANFESSETGFTNGKKRIKKIKRTYSGLTKIRQPVAKGSNSLGFKNRNNSLLPGEVLVPTPVLTRVRSDRLVKRDFSVTVEPLKCDDENYGERNFINSNTPCKYRNFELLGQYEFRQHSINTRYNIYEGIYHSLELLLHITSETKTVRKSNGARSLLDMTIRIVPQYILEQQNLLRIHLHESRSKSTIQYRDICSEIYNELENFGISGNGWKKLRDIVRAHGVQILSDAIKEGLFDSEFCTALIILCVRNSAIEEAQKILSSLLSYTTFPLPTTVDDTPCKPLRLLKRFSMHINKKEYFYRQMSILISEGALPFEWLASKSLGTIWTGLIQSLALDSLEHEAICFCDITFCLFLKYPNIPSNETTKINVDVPLITINKVDDAIKNTFSSLLTTLISIVLLDTDSERQNLTKTTSSYFKRFDFIVSFLRRCLNYEPGKEDISEQYLLLIFANLILLNESCLLTSSNSILDNLPNVLKKIKDSTTKFTKVTTFIYQIARCCGKGNSGLGFDYLQLIHLRLKEVNSDIETLKFLKKVIVDSAILFARRIPHYKHVEYASSLDATYLTQSYKVTAAINSSSESNNEEFETGFRWEEGIGEWIAATPVPRNLKRKRADTSNPICDSLPRKLVSPRLKALNESKNCRDTFQNSEITSGVEFPTNNFILSPCTSRIKSNFLTPLPKNSYINSEKFGEQDNINSSVEIFNNNPKLREKYIESQGQCSIANDELIKFNFKASCYQDSLMANISPVLLDRVTRQPKYFTCKSPQGLRISKPNQQSQEEVSLQPIPSPNPVSSHNIVSYRRISRCKEALDFFSSNDDEDELSILTFTNSSVSGYDLTSCQTDTRLPSKSNSVSSFDFRHAINTKSNHTKLLKSNTSISRTRIRKLKKPRSPKKRTRNFGFFGKEDWSEDELCK